MRALFLVIALSVCGFGQGFVRPWVVKAPEKAAGTLRSPFLEVAAQETPPAPRQVRLPVEWPASQGFPFPLVLTPCTTFPGNPVFLIEGDKITMLKLGR